MFAKPEDLATLLEIQRIDLSIMQSKKKRAELPQRVKVMRLRQKRAEVQDKLDQVIDLQAQVDAKMTKVEDEDRSLQEKQQRAQEIIDAAGSDYRKVESHSKEMAGVAKRRDELAERMAEIGAELEKIHAVRGQLETAIAASEEEEKRIRASFEEEDQALVSFIRESTAKRAELAGGIDAGLLALYEKTAAKAGGVGVGVLEEDACGICRAQIEGGRLIELKAAAPLGACPNCKRLLVVQ